MILRFDIFQVEAAGGVMWRGAVSTLDEAHMRVKEFAKFAPAEYIIMNQKTGEKISVRPGARNDEAKPAAARQVDVRYPAWERFYLDVLLEEDPPELFKKVGAAETAIIRRLQQLHGSSNGAAERTAIQEASDVLLSIKTRKLNFPDWKSSEEEARF